ncbi:MAG: SEC-C metal-binding domain-containing protein [Steroidobacteraceae bacterium]
MKPGRNEACPCGSGKKYKHCCLTASVAATETPAELAWRRIRRANEGLVGKMIQFALDAYGDEAIDDAWAEFMFWEQQEDRHQSPHGGGLFLPWMLHHWSPHLDENVLPDETLYHTPPTRAYLARKGKHLDPTARRYLEACLVAPFGFHEIIDCNPGQGFRTTELITGDQHEVLERSGSQNLQKGDVLYASLVCCDGIVLLEGVAPTVIPPGCKLPILQFRGELPQERDLFSNALLLEYDIELRALYFEVMEPILNPLPPMLLNTDGDELSLQRLIFDIDSAQETFDALKHLALDAGDERLLAQAERGADGNLLRVEFQWSKAGNRVHKGWTNTTLGTIEIDRQQLSVHVNSDQRAAKFKRVVGKALGARARYRATEIQTMDSQQEDAQRMEDGDPLTAAEKIELAAHPEIKAQLFEMMSRHYEGWLREKIPALGGKTPLQAAKDPTGREMVEALVSQIERDGRRMMPPLDESIPHRLRERLGLSTHSPH